MLCSYPWAAFIILSCPSDYCFYKIAYLGLSEQFLQWLRLCAAMKCFFYHQLCFLFSVDVFTCFGSCLSKALCRTSTRELQFNLRAKWGQSKQLDFGWELGKTIQDSYCVYVF